MARERLIWAIDCDDVVVPTAEVVVAAYNERYGTLVQLEGYYDADAWGAPSPSDVTGRISDLLREIDIAPAQETVEALFYLASMDELHMVTGRQSFLEETTHRMLDKYLLGVFSSVEHTNYSTIEENGAGNRSKGEVCTAIEAEVLIDDHIVHASSVLGSGLKEAIVWGDYPWNRDHKISRGMVRCIAWEEVFRERERILAS